MAYMGFCAAYYDAKIRRLTIKKEETQGTTVVKEAIQKEMEECRDKKERAALVAFIVYFVVVIVKSVAVLCFPSKS